MPAPLRCPTCSAPLDVPPEHATTTRCTYCGAGVLLTERAGHVQAAAAQQRHADAVGDVLNHLRVGDTIGAVRAYRDHFGVGMAEARYALERIQTGQRSGAAPAAAGSAPAAPYAAPPPSGRPRAAVAAAVMVVAVSAGIGVVAVRTTVESTVSAPGAAAPASALRAEDGGFAEEVLRFGGEGNGAGRFEDARSVAVDGARRLYVPDYANHRVQVFDSAGTFITQWLLDPELGLSDIAVDRRGTVYLVEGGRIRRVEGTTGRLLHEFPRPRLLGYQHLALALDGTVWAANLHGVYHLDRDGRMLRHISVSEVVPDGGSPSRVAVSGEGHLYVTSLMGNEIYHLDPDGRFIDRFGPAAEPGRPTPMMQQMAFDGRGRLYVSLLGRGIHVYEPNGTQIGAIASDEAPFGLAFNDRDELYAVLRNDQGHQVVKYRLKR